MDKMKTNNIDNRNEMEQLLARFMDGLTSPDEEQRIAQYMRRDDVPEEWNAYKEMFAYFDEGMPQGRYDEPQTRRHTRRTALWTGLATAAAAALFVTMTLTRQTTTLPAVQPMAVASMPDSTSTRTYDAATDSLNMHNGQKAKPKSRSYYKYKYQPAPPKTYYAKADGAAAEGESTGGSNASPTTGDNISAAADRLVAEQLELMEKQQQIMMLKAEADSRIADTQALMAASADMDDYQEAN